MSEAEWKRIVSLGSSNNCPVPIVLIMFSETNVARQAISQHERAIILFSDSEMGSETSLTKLYKQW